MGIFFVVMNHELDCNILKNNERYFTVQSEQYFWLVVSFWVAKESFDILQWVFGHKKFLDLSQKQGEGQQLEVDGVGTFKVEWYLFAGMNTIKCLYGLKHGENVDIYAYIAINYENKE